MSSRKPGSQSHGQQSAEEDNFKKPTRSNTGASSGKKAAENFLASGSVRKTRKNKQRTPGNRYGGSTSKAPQTPGKERAWADLTVESEDAFKNRMEVKVKMPEESKPWLVGDWNLQNVDAILKENANCKTSQGNAVNEIVTRIKEYFDVMLGTQLLYKFERPLYAEILLAHPDAPVLFVRIGEMLAYISLDEKSLALLLGHLHDFLKYLAKNSASLFTGGDYKVASAKYHHKALCWSTDHSLLFA
uniref:Mortality factor 4-like protein 2 n=1 Tax=Pan paniscus TaxID=9597 RepID=A0A2R9ALX5_PANPA